MWPNMLCPYWFHIERVLCCNSVFPPHAHLFNRKSESRSIVSDSLRPHGLYRSWNSPGQNTGVGSLSLLQEIFPTQVSHIAGGFFTRWATHVKNLPAMQEMQEMGSIPGSGKSPGRGQYSCLENSMDRGACQDTVHRIAKSQMPMNVHLLRFQLLNLPSPCSVFKVQHKDSMVETSIYRCIQNNQNFFFLFWNWLLGSYHNFDLYMPYDNIEQSLCRVNYKGYLLVIFKNSIVISCFDSTGQWKNHNRKLQNEKIPQNAPN